MAEARTIRELVALSKPWLEQKGVDNARLDAELLIAHALGLKRIDLFLDLDRPLSPDEIARCRALIAERGKRTPVSQLVGAREFFGLPFIVTKHVLTPRPDTELLVEIALEKTPADAAGTFVDACTGSGCVALAILHHRPGLRAVATDVSAPALDVAKRNAAALGLADRFDARAGDLLAPVSESVRFVVANPPYIRTRDKDALMPEVRLHEPAVALFGDDDDGLGHHRRILAQARVDAFVALEIGADQGEAARALAAPGFAAPTVRKDLAALDRVVVWERAPH